MIKREGTKLVVDLPAEYDSRTEYVWYKDVVVAVHPDFPPLEVDLATGEIRSLTPEKPSQLN